MLRQILGEIDDFSKSSMDGLHTIFEVQMNDLTMRALNYKEQISNPSSYFYATPSFKVGNRTQFNSTKKPFPFSFNSGSAKKTPLKSPPNLLHKTPIGSPGSYRKHTPLGTRNFDQEQNIQANAIISHSPLFKFVKSPTQMTSGGNKKKRKSSSSASKRINSSPQIHMGKGGMELPKEIELFTPIPPLEFDKDLGIEKDEMEADLIHPVESTLLVGKKNSVMSVDTELNSEPVVIPPHSQQVFVQPINKEASNLIPSQQTVTIQQPIFQLPKVKEEPLSDEEEIVIKKKERQPRRKPNRLVQQQPIPQTVQPQPLQQIVQPEPPKEPEVVVIEEDEKSDVTEQISCLLISDAFEENERKEQERNGSKELSNMKSFVVKEEVVDSPEVINKTFNRSCMDGINDMNISIIKPIEDERKQTEFSFLSKTSLFQHEGGHLFKGIDDNSSDDSSLVCFSASEDDLFDDEKEHNEKDVCVKIEFVPPTTEGRVEQTEQIISDTQSLFSQMCSLKQPSNNVEPIKISSLQEKINSLKSEPSFLNIHSIMPNNIERPSLELSEPPCTPTRANSISGAIEKLGQLSIHNKIDVMFSSPEVELSPPPFDSIPDFSSPKFHSLQNIKIKKEVITPKSYYPKSATTPDNKMELNTPPVSAIKEPPTVSQHGKYKPFTPKFMEPRSVPLDNDNVTGSTIYEDPFATLRKDSIDIIDIDENEHKRKFNTKLSTESNDQKRLKLSDGNRISISSVSSVSSISSFHSTASIGSFNGPTNGGNLVSNIFTGVKSFVFKVTHNNKNKTSGVGATSKKAISSLKLAEAAKKKEEEKKTLKKEKLEKQLALQKKKKEQEERLKEDQTSKKQSKLVKPTNSQKAIVEGLTLGSGSRSSNSSTGSNTTAAASKKDIGPMNRPTTKKSTTSLQKQPEPRISSYDLSDEVDSSEDDEVAKKRRQHKKIPSWASGDNLKNNLKRTRKIDPDRIFGSVRSCDLEEIFSGSTNQILISRARNRTSSSNWTEDHFTIEEDEEYRKEMGFIY